MDNIATFLANQRSPTDNILKAVQLAQGVQQYKANQLNLEQSVATQESLTHDLNWLSSNATPSNIAQVSVKYPQLAEKFKIMHDVASVEEQNVRVKEASQVHASLMAGDTETAAKLMDDKTEAAKNSGDAQSAKISADLAKLIRTSPKTALMTSGLMLATAMGKDKYIETFTGLENDRRANELQPAAMTKAQAEAHSAAVASKYAESKAVQDLVKVDWDIAKVQNDIQVSRENVKIAALNAELARAKNDIERQSLQQKIDAANEKRDQTIRDKTAAVQTAAMNIDNSLNTIDRLMKNPALQDVVGAVEGGDYYPTTLVAGLNPVGSSADDRANAIADIETIKSQQFVNALTELKNASATGASGLGALSKEEGQRLIDKVQSLSRKQGEKQFRENLSEVQRLLMKARKTTAAKYGMPETLPDRPNVAVTAEKPTSDVPLPSTEGFKFLGVE